jgi:hypothetical protein
MISSHYGLVSFECKLSKGIGDSQQISGIVWFCCPYFHICFLSLFIEVLFLNFIVCTFSQHNDEFWIFIEDEGIRVDLSSQ